MRGRDGFASSHFSLWAQCRSLGNPTSLDGGKRRYIYSGSTIRLGDGRRDKRGGAPGTIIGSQACAQRGGTAADVRVADGPINGCGERGCREGAQARGGDPGPELGHPPRPEELVGGEGRDYAGHTGAQAGGGGAGPAVMDDRHWAERRTCWPANGLSSMVIGVWRWPHDFEVVCWRKVQQVLDGHLNHFRRCRGRHYKLLGRHAELNEEPLNTCRKGSLEQPRGRGTLNSTGNVYLADTILRRLLARDCIMRRSG